MNEDKRLTRGKRLYSSFILHPSSFCIPGPTGGQWFVKTVGIVLRQRAYRGDFSSNRKPQGHFYRLDGEGDVIEATALGGAKGKEYTKDKEEGGRRKEESSAALASSFLLPPSSFLLPKAVPRNAMPVSPWTGLPGHSLPKARGCQALCPQEVVREYARTLSPSNRAGILTKKGIERPRRGSTRCQPPRGEPTLCPADR